MKRITAILLTLFIFMLISCSSPVEVTSELVMKTYIEENRSFNLNDKGISGFVNLNGLNGETEIVNIYLSDNSIEVLNISEYTDLGRLVIANNGLRFFGDIKYPAQIRHLDLSGNVLESLDGIEKLTELKTLNVSNNKLDDEDFKILAGLEKLQLILLDGNNVSEELQNNMVAFNAAYLGRIKQ